MFDSRLYIGMPYEKAKSILLEQGYNVQELENTADDKHAYDTKLVVRVDKKNNQITLTTAKFLMNI